MKNKVNNKEVTGHLFEYTTSFGLDPNLHFKYPDKGIVPTQIILCIKEKNQKKINSHRWFFNAFAPMLQVSAPHTHCVPLTDMVDSQMSVCCWMWVHAREIAVYTAYGKRSTVTRMLAARVVRSRCIKGRTGSTFSTPSVGTLPIKFETYPDLCG